MYRDRVVEFAALASALLRARGKFDEAIAAARTAQLMQSPKKRF
jgi:hypothetical protein